MEIIIIIALLLLELLLIFKVNTRGKFKKVSYDEFKSGMKEIAEERNLTDTELYNMYSKIQLPTRATKGSAGYDISTPIGFVLPPHSTIKIPTGLRVKINNGWFLGVFPRSGLGFKYRLQLDNTVGIIDSDYYNSSNEGHMFLKITNDTYEEKMLKIEAGDKIAQSIFLPYGIASEDKVKAKRDGGFGSTGA